ncbi:MAG TPA: exodeoxyribonuclease VII large subunit [Kiritimatiellia bacterium]|nr:exodeoxyribonuclease VII large subunit [Kiritimatiellia bacterium]HRU70420.1 exodeoxyribonuclease VII large subunit [Kiritimatiellia bacterium]
METAGRRVYSVSELTRRIKQTLEDEVGRVWVEGEISNFKVYPSGHAYFSLKDAGAQLNAVLFAGSRSGVAAGTRLEDGQRVRAYGEITVFESRGQYQLIVRKVEPMGDGDLMRRFLELKQRLEAEGLFDKARKRPLPLLPQRIGIVTSPTGAVIHDMTTVLGRRFPNLHIRLAPVKVQGVGAAQEIAAAVRLFNRVYGPGSDWPADLLIVGRGGGSLEDLWAFNEECVARAVAESAIPVISAVGHDTDFSLCDFAADVRAPTPSAAAELAVTTKKEWEQRLAQPARALEQALRRQVTALRMRVVTASSSRFFQQPRQLVERRAQQVDTLAMRMDHAVAQRAQESRQRTERAHARLRVVRERYVHQTRARLDQQARRLEAACRLRLERLRTGLAGSARQLGLLSPLAVLERGYSLTRGPDGRLVRSSRDLRSGVEMSTQFKDGHVVSVVR